VCSRAILPHLDEQLGLGQFLSVLGRKVREFRLKPAKDTAEFQMESL
jgi:hypothetical protein